MVKVHYAMKSQTSWDEATHAAHPIKNVVSCPLYSFIALTSTCRDNVPACCYSFSYGEFGSYPSMLTLVLAASIDSERHITILSFPSTKLHHVMLMPSPQHGTRFQEYQVFDHLWHMSASAKVASGRSDC